MFCLRTPYLLFALSPFFFASVVPALASPPDRGIGQRLPDFTLRDTTGQEVQLYGFAGKRGAAILFIGSTCRSATSTCRGSSS